MANSILPKYQTSDQSFSLLQTAWSALIDPIIGRTQNQSLILPGVSLSIGTTTISHRLGRRLQGWQPIRQRSAASIYDVQDTNSTPELTLLLVSDAVVSIDLEVF